MNGSSAATCIQRPCIEVLADIQEALARKGLRSLETFDLQAARLGAADCPCPHHGTAECDCQMVVLLVYGASGSPVTLILHGSDGETFVSAADQAGPGVVESSLVAAVEQSIHETASLSRR